MKATESGTCPGPGRPRALPDFLFARGIPKRGPQEKVSLGKGDRKLVLGAIAAFSFNFLA